ncbi:hypothetical protein BAUCODRAFT_152823 [Baudoinia panamericana UAMH 10762]|uniref:PD-(D/E)XK nuclease-like domain-containing protein n=1 Tax=Baudoinia panamericana (strain UAMH 10762) TaxID=717646 RepID=M2M3F0_BAUPA|nr:uncharacterized protein BAUCODRAFT_152823 [Baudoinia panamericana UAMH 10762]EMC91051.1 hypothetical protein BAUCODRAFT_152823 [Baudoinia panamericana UAMH 10762]
MWCASAIIDWIETTGSPVTPTRPIRKRALVEIDPNIDRPRGAKRRRTDTAAAETAMAMTNDYTDMDKTPRRGHRLVLTAPLTPGISGSQTISSRSESEYATSSTAKRKRTGSPTKRLYERQFASYPVSDRSFTGLQHCSLAIRDLVIASRDCAKGRKILSERYSEWKQALATGMDEDDEAMFARGAAEQERDLVGDVPSLKWTSRQVERAEHANSTGASESAWNNEVHSNLLEAAIAHSPFVDRVTWHDITTARIHPKDLVPEFALGGLVDSKSVDFCIALKLDTSIQQLLYARGIDGLNHTDYTGIKWEPIVVSIETKKAMSGSADATLQLSTWTTAHIKFLRRLLCEAGNATVTILPLPLLMVVGHEWRFYWIEDHMTSGTLWQGEIIGKTDSALGIYQIMKALQYLAYWANQTYLPWFEKHILVPILHMGNPESMAD